MKKATKRAMNRAAAVAYLVDNPTANAYQVSKATGCSYTYAAKLIKQRGTPVEKLANKVHYTNDLLNDREKTHGDIFNTAALAQRLKYEIHQAYAEHDTIYSFVHREAIDMICTKLARIVCGNPDEPDHWRDIKGYAELVLRDLENDEDK